MLLLNKETKPCYKYVKSDLSWYCWANINNIYIHENKCKLFILEILLRKPLVIPISDGYLRRRSVSLHLFDNWNSNFHILNQPSSKLHYLQCLMNFTVRIVQAAHKHSTVICTHLEGKTRTQNHKPTWKGPARMKPNSSSTQVCPKFKL